MPESIEEQIRQAMQEGKFDNLPGKGQPLRLDENPHEDPEWRLAHHMLHGSGYTLPWIAARNEIEAEIEAARLELLRTWTWRREALDEVPLCLPYEQVERAWQRAVEAFREQALCINKRILAYNLQAPLERFQLLPLNVEQEIKRAKGLTDQ